MRELFSVRRTGLNDKSKTVDDKIMGKTKELKIAESLSLLMDKKGLGVKELSYKSGVPQKTIYHLLSGRTGDIPTIEKLAEAFSVSLHFILFGMADPRDPTAFNFEDLLSGHFEIVVRKRTVSKEK